MRLTRVGTGIVIGILLASAPAKAQLQAAGAVVQIAATTFNILNSMGVFASAGIGEDAKLESKLNEIISQLNTVESYVMAIDNDIKMSTQALVNQTVDAELGTVLPEMVTARGDILQCADTLATWAAKPHSDANDAMLRELALELVGSGTENGDCVSVRSDFSMIHAQIVSDPLLGPSSGVYTLIARIARANGVPFQNIAEHFVQFELVQREVVELLRNAYTLIGDPTTLQHVLTVSPNYLGELHDEEVSFLMATDTYIAASPTTPHVPSPAQLADAIVQSLEGTLRQATTYSASIFNDAQTTLTPVLTPPSSGTTVPMSDTVSGVSWSYYDTSETSVLAHIEGCDTSTGQGISYLEPAGSHNGFYLRYTCNVHVERHLNANLPLAVDATWTVTGRHGSAPLGAPALRNAVTFDDETAADALALAADPAAGKSQFSSLSVVADTIDPTQVTLTVDLPGQPGAGIGTGTTHGLVAGSTSPIVFTREPGGPTDLDQYSFKTPAGTYLTIGSDGYAALSTTPTYFDLQTTPDGHDQIVTSDNQLLYVDVQHQQFFYGEVPDDVWANNPNLATAAAIPSWTYPSDGTPRTYATDQLYFYPPCLDPSSGAAAFAELTDGTPESTCSDGIPNPSLFGFPSPLTYVIYNAVIMNEDSSPHAFEVMVGGDAIGPAASVESGTTYAGIHCYVLSAGSPLDHLDTAGVGTQPQQTTATGPAGPWAVTVPAKSTTGNGSATIQCQVLDHLYPPAILVINDFGVRPCTDQVANNTCTPFQPSP